jgi:hypothetical protein
MAARPRTTPTPHPARRASSAAGIAPASRNACKTRRRAGVSFISPASAARLAALGAYVRRGGGGNSASATLIAMRKTAPGGAIV